MANYLVYKQKQVNVNRSLFILLAIVLPSAVFSQKVKISEISQDYYHHQDVEGFYYLHEDLENDEAFYWVADLRVDFDTIYPHTINQIYRRFLVKANKLGANSFRVEGSDIYANGGDKYVKVKTYFLRQERRAANKELFYDNVVRLYGFLGHHQSIEGYDVSINDKKMLLTELRYKEIKLTIGDHLKIKILGGLRGEIVEFDVTPNLVKKYYYFELFKGMMSKGKISEYSWGFGELLAHILRKDVVSLH